MAAHDIAIRLVNGRLTVSVDGEPAVPAAVRLTLAWTGLHDLVFGNLVGRAGIFGQYGKRRLHRLRCGHRWHQQRCYKRPARRLWSGYAIVERFHFDKHDQQRTHIAAYLEAYNFAQTLKTLGGLTHYEYICKVWTSEPDRFILDPIPQVLGPNS